MKRLLVYSHDTFGLESIQRMLSLCTHLIDSIPDLLILLVSGSSMIHSFRVPQRLDYIKLPCLRRTEHEGYSAASSDRDTTDISDIMRLRSDLILGVATNYKPDLLMVNKKPFGVKNELENTLMYLKMHLPDTRQILILHDILDSLEATIKVWEKNVYYDAIRLFYDLVLDDGCSSSSLLQPDLGALSKITDCVLALLSSTGRERKEAMQEQSLYPVSSLNRLSDFKRVTTHPIHEAA